MLRPQAPRVKDVTPPEVEPTTFRFIDRFLQPIYQLRHAPANKLTTMAAANGTQLMPCLLGYAACRCCYYPLVSQPSVLVYGYSRCSLHHVG